MTYLLFLLLPVPTCPDTNFDPVAGYQCHPRGQCSTLFQIYQFAGQRLHCEDQGYVDIRGFEWANCKYQYDEWIPCPTTICTSPCRHLNPSLSNTHIMCTQPYTCPSYSQVTLGFCRFFCHFCTFVTFFIAFALFYAKAPKQATKKRQQRQKSHKS